MRFVALVACTTALIACGKEEKTESHRDSDDTPAAVVNLDPNTITKAELALGDSVFHGMIGAVSCQACHGPNGKGGPQAADLTDQEWLHSDGTYTAIYHTIETGVMNPTKAAGVMPPFGGAPMTPAQHRAVAAYVYSLSHKVDAK